MVINKGCREVSYHTKKILEILEVTTNLGKILFICQKYTWGDQWRIQTHRSCALSALHNNRGARAGSRNEVPYRSLRRGGVTLTSAIHVTEDGDGRMRIWVYATHVSSRFVIKTSKHLRVRSLRHRLEINFLCTWTASPRKYSLQSRTKNHFLPSPPPSSSSHFFCYPFLFIPRKSVKETAQRCLAQMLGLPGNSAVWFTVIGS